MVDFRALVPWRSRSQAPATREDFFDPFVTFRREVDRMFDAFFEGFGELRPAGGGWQALRPLVDVAETDKSLVVTAELPGVDDKDIEVTLSGDVLTIKGEKKADREQRDGDYTYVERHYGSFARSVRLPFEVKDEDIEAKFDKGVLTITVPKPAEAQKSVRKIEVKAS